MSGRHLKKAYGYYLVANSEPRLYKVCEVKLPYGYPDPDDQVCVVRWSDNKIDTNFPVELCNWLMGRQ